MGRGEGMRRAAVQYVGRGGERGRRDMFSRVARRTLYSAFLVFSACLNVLVCLFCC